MKQIDSLLLLFGFLEKSETFESFDELKTKASSKNIIEPTSHDLEQALGKLPNRDRATIDIHVDELDPVTYNPSKDIIEFLTELNDILSIKDESSIVSVHLTIRKVINKNKISLYDLEQFTEYLESLSLAGLLYSFNQIVSAHDYIMFELLNDENRFSTQMFKFAPTEIVSIDPVQVMDRYAVLHKHTDICNYLNASEYHLIPNDFHMVDYAPDRISAIFSKLCAILSLIFIADISKIVGDDELYFRVNGYKMIQNTFSFSSLSQPNTKELYSIYEWIYNEGNLSDKVGLSRNIITLNYQVDLVIKDTTYASIRSGYEIYLKKNIEQYIEVKNKVSEFLMNMSYKSSEIVSTFSNSIKNSNFVFLTFFLSVIVFNTLSTGKINLIFTREIQILSYSILGISLVFLLITVFYTFEATTRFKKQYKNLKSMYTDIIEENDLHNIFNKDQGHKDDLDYIFNKTVLYAIFWFFEIFIIFIAILIASNP